MADQAGVHINSVTKRFGETPVLDGIFLDVAPGSVTAILGPSGCGKSTLLRIIAGFEDPDDGAVRIAGTTVADRSISVPAHRRRIGLMPQEGALFPHRDVAANITFGLGRISRRQRESEVARWLELVGLDGFADAHPHQLSGGQQQRVALARALAARPQVLLLDEPFASLDTGLRARVREDITAILRESGTTAILVTHDQAEALSLADQVAVLLDGRIAQHGAPADLYRRPASLGVARFVGGTIEIAGHVRAGVISTPLGEHPVRNTVADGAVTAVIRPEQATVVPGDGADSAVVTDLRFYGPHTAVRIGLVDGTVLELPEPGHGSVTVGESVRVHVRGSVLAFTTA